MARREAESYMWARGEEDQLGRRASRPGALETSSLSHPGSGSEAEVRGRSFVESSSVMSGTSTSVMHNDELGEFEDDDEEAERAAYEMALNEDSGETIESLDEVPFNFVIHDPQASLFLFEYLSQGTKLDLLMFWMSVEEYKQSVGQIRSLTTQAEKIWERYFDREPNILSLVETRDPFYSRSADLERIKKMVKRSVPILDLFSSAQHYVEAELRYLYRTGFRESSSFRALVTQLKGSRKVNVHQVLDSERYSPFFARYIQKNLRGHFGNYLFLVEANDNYRARAHARATGIPTRLGTYSSTSSFPPRRGSLGNASGLSVSIGATSPAQTAKAPLGRTRSQGPNDAPGRPLSARRSEDMADGHRLLRQRSELPSVNTPRGAGNVEGQGRPRSLMSRRDTFAPQRDQNRPSSIIDMLPVSAAPSSAALELRMERQFLLDLLDAAYGILDKYLSRSSSVEATLVSDNAKRAASQQLEEIAAELGGSTGKLASVSSFASISANRAILDQLAHQLENVFVLSQQDVLRWMQDTVFPAFRESEGYAALIALIEEENSEAHRTRNRLSLILHGRIYSERLLVLPLPPRPVSDAKAAEAADAVIRVDSESRGLASSGSNSRLKGSNGGMKGLNRNNSLMAGSTGSLKSFFRSHSMGKMNKHASVVDLATLRRRQMSLANSSISKSRRERDGVSTSRRRHSSFLWNGSREGDEEVPIVSGVVKLTCDLLANERLLEANPMVCDCECHFTCSEAKCTCSCASPSLSFRGGGLLFRTRTEMTLDPNHAVAAAGADGVRAENLGGFRGRNHSFDEEEDTDEEDTDGYDDEEDMLDDEEEDSPHQHVDSASSHYARDGGRHVKFEHAHFKGIESLENLSGLPPDLHAYMLPLGLQVRVVDLENADWASSDHLKVNLWIRPSADPENISGYILPSPRPRRSFTRITVRDVVGEDGLQLTAADMSTEICHVREQRMNAAERKRWISRVREQVMAMTPAPTIHPVTMPCRQHHHPERASKLRFWYGAVHTSYKLMQVDCPIASQRDAEEMEMESSEPMHGLDSTNDEAEVSTMDNGYHEIVIRLAKHSKYGLGMNLALTQTGFVELESFITRLDGSICPAKRSGALKIRDLLVSVNDRDVSNRKFSDVIDQIVRSPSPVKFTFVRGYTHKVERCLACGKTKCEPTFAFVPEPVALLSYGRPYYQQLRRSMDEVLPAFANSPLEVQPLTTTVRRLNAYMRHEIANGVRGRSQNLAPGPARPHYPFSHLFKFVRKEHVADVLASLLLNRPLLLLSDSASAVVFVAEALRSMLWPFVWKHTFNPLLPVALARAHAERRAKKIEELESIRSDQASSRQQRYLSAPFFMGMCTRGLGARDTYLGEFAGYDDIRDYMLQEHDNQSPMERFLAVRALEPLLLDGTLVLDIDSDVLDIPRPSREDLQNLAEQQQNYSGTNKPVDPSQPIGPEWVHNRDTRLALTRFSHPLFRMDDTVVSRRPRTSSMSSATSTLSMGMPPVAQETLIPSFPESLRDKLIEDWAMIPEKNATLAAYHEKLMQVHAKLLTNYRAFCLTYDLNEDDEDDEEEEDEYEMRSRLHYHRGSSNGLSRAGHNSSSNHNLRHVPPSFDYAGGHNIMVSFNVRAFLSKCMRIHRPYLNTFLRTKSFALFLTESLYTGSEIFDGIAAAPGASSSLEDVDLLATSRSRTRSRSSSVGGPVRRSSLTVLREEEPDSAASLPASPPLPPVVVRGLDAQLSASLDEGEEDDDDKYDDNDDQEEEDDEGNLDDFEEDENSDENEDVDAHFRNTEQHAQVEGDEEDDDESDEGVVDLDDGVEEDDDRVDSEQEVVDLDEGVEDSDGRNGDENLDENEKEEEDQDQEEENDEDGEDNDDANDDEKGTNEQQDQEVGDKDDDDDDDDGDDDVDDDSSSPPDESASNDGVPDDL
ncbi:Hypothetical Protein FCC1311_034922 [Hondaea fermentalgiana]|uniref:Uncharacterized protein n=1 Tax=Hondaea fermentalgiana TaxID=2315210 RepID=A0A2R5G8E5_9STRA|nr:Hypothetical Protein FCC1311_034922 [Hondaea fermentalgiana]|eukprot:GBG27270.1 Hypothetical Protein FCC1311_034922 [Hondaea fermentalgiana]